MLVSTCSECGHDLEPGEVIDDVTEGLCSQNPEDHGSQVFEDYS